MDNNITLDKIKEVFGDLFYNRISEPRRCTILISGKNKAHARRKARAFLGFGKNYFFIRRLKSR